MAPIKRIANINERNSELREKLDRIKRKITCNIKIADKENPKRKPEPKSSKKKHSVEREEKFAEPAGYYVPNRPFEARTRTHKEDIIISEAIHEIQNKMELHALLKKRAQLIKKISQL